MRRNSTQMQSDIYQKRKKRSRCLESALKYKKKKKIAILRKRGSTLLARKSPSRNCNRDDQSGENVNIGNSRFEIKR